MQLSASEESVVYMLYNTGMLNKCCGMSVINCSVLVPSQVQVYNYGASLEALERNAAKYPEIISL
jgi:hypothetical protein